MTAGTGDTFLSCPGIIREVPLIEPLFVGALIDFLLQIALIPRAVLLGLATVAVSQFWREGSATATICLTERCATLQEVEGVNTCSGHGACNGCPTGRVSCGGLCLHTYKSPANLAKRI